MAANETLKQMFSSQESIILGSLAFYKLLIQAQTNSKSEAKLPIKKS